MRRLRRAFAGTGAAAVLAVCLTGCFSAPPQIIALEPNRGSTSVAADAPVRVTFDKPVVPSSVAGRLSVDPPLPGCDLTAAFAALPAAPCWIHWLPNSDAFELIHQGAVLAPATRYTFTLAGGFADPAGDVNGLDHHWDLTSAAAPRVTSINPADGSTAVALDSPIAVSFNAAMDPTATGPAISLQPSVPGTRVFRNVADHTRFVVLPGQLLEPHATYTIVVSAAARGEDRQPLAAPQSARFVSSTRLGAAHAVVLAGLPGEAATEVLLPALAPASGGEPVATPLVLRAGRCAAATCGSVPAKGPLQAFSAATVSANAGHVAVVVEALDGPAAASQLEVIDTTTSSVVARISGGARPSWSPSGRLVAYAAGGGVAVFNTATGLSSVAAADTQLAGVPLWSGDSILVLSTAPTATASGGVELVDLALGASYALPGAPAGAAAIAVSDSGTQLAVITPSGVEVLPVGAGGGAAQRLTGRLGPLGFSGEGTLVALAFGNPEQLVRIDIAGGDSEPVPLGVAQADLASVRVATGGRRLAFVGIDPLGVSQAYIANADGSGPLPLTRSLVGGLQARAVEFAS